MRRQQFRWASLAVELAIVPENPPFVEWYAPLRGEIGGYARPLRHAVMQRNHARHLPFESLHPLRKGIAQAFDDLEQRQVNVAKLAAKEVRTAVACDQAFEIAEIFRHAALPETRTAALGFRALLLVIERARNR